MKKRLLTLGMIAASIALPAALLLPGCSGGDGGDDQLGRLARRLVELVSGRHPGYKHVLIVTVDTLRPDYLGMNGYDLPTSPTLDSLVARGTYFSHALTTVPRTTQALGSLLTGCYPHTTGLRTLYDEMDPDVLSIAQLARRSGYRTIAVVSNTILPPKRGLGRGFEVYDYAGNIRDAQLTTDAAIAHLRTLEPADSIFLWVHYIDPHVPYYPPERIVDEFDPSYRGRYRYHFGTVPGGVGNNAYPPDLGKKRAVFMNDLPDSVNAHLRRLYAAEVRYTDESIARLVGWLRDNLGDDWLVVFTADHGESLGEHDYYYDHGDYVYNASLRIPLAFVLPPGDKMSIGRRVDDWVSIIDIMPTLVELLDLEMPGDPPYRVEGRSLVPFLRGGTLQERPCFAECGRSFFPDMVKRRTDFTVAGRSRAVVLDRWKLIWTPGGVPGEYELYDVVLDPGETRNIVGVHGEKADELIAVLEEWTDTAYEEKELSEEDIRLLRSLGYIQ